MARRRIQSIRRRRPQRGPKRRFFIYCEGKETEPAYFAEINRLYDSTIIKVETIGAVGVPFTVACAAVDRKKDLNHSTRKARNSFEEGDEVWAVFDHDAHPKVKEAVKKCEDNDVGVARSNPCFELWLILHKANYDKPDEQKKVQAHLKKLCPEYNKRGAKTPNCAELVTRVKEAEKRAETQLSCRGKEGDPFNRPSTTVWRLTRAIRDAAQKAR
jgi:hypothetical protein